MSCDVTSSSSGQDETVGQSKSWWGHKVLIIITGASRGFGKAIAIKLATRFHQYHNLSCVQQPQLSSSSSSSSSSLLSSSTPPSSAKVSFLLLSRVTTNLVQVTAELQRTGPGIANIQPVPGQLNDYDNLAALDFIMEHERQDYDQVILVHNAGTLNDPDQLVDSYTPRSISELNEYARVNFSSAVIITSSFLRSFRNCPKRNIINITSLAAIEPMKGLALYGSMKAARDRYFKSVAYEDPSTRVLSYAPGPLKTDMASILANRGHLTDFFQDQNNLLDPEDSADRMIQILENDNYDNGAHIDYWDPLP